MKKRVIGCGNLIVGDDGLGVRVIEELRELSLPENIELIEGAVRGINLLDYFMDTDKVIIVDAVNFGQEIGTIRRFDLQELEGMSKNTITTLHQIGISETVKLGLKLYPDDICRNIVLIGMEVGYIDKVFCMELSPKIKKLLPDLLDKVIQEIES